MTLGGWFRRRFGRAPAARISSPEPRSGRRGSAGADARSRPSGADAERLSDTPEEQSDAMLAALKAGCLDPPRDLHDGNAWDDYWKNQMDFGVMYQWLMDDMASDPTFPGLLSRRGSQTILCVGNGLSTEALSLALFGFDVTALDISAIPAQVYEGMMRDPEHAVHQIPGFGMREDGSVTFGAPGLIDPDLCPAMHRGSDHPPKGGGSLSFVTGDFTTPEICPGPFDVVIERRTLQLFRGVDPIGALDRLVARLGDRGIFVSHEHRGRWKPGDPCTHFAEAWLKSRGFVLRSSADSEECDATARLACLTFSTG